MNTITISTEVGGPQTYKVFKVLRPTRVLVDFGGALVVADYVGDHWEQFAGSLPSEDEAALKQALADYGTLDRTVTTVTKDE